MKPCPLCTAAVPDDAAITASALFCGACGRNTEQVQRAPTLPPGAVAFGTPPPSQAGFGGAPPVVPPGNSPSPGGQPGWPPPQGDPQAVGSQPGTPNQQAWPPPGGQQQQAWPPPGGPPPGNQQQAWPPPGGQQQYAQNIPTVLLSAAPPGLNWGGFLLPFLWGPFNKVWIGLVSLVAFIPFIGWIGSLGISVYLLIKGNELAWRSGRLWQSVEEFHAVQKAWTMWGLIVAGISIVISIISSVIIALSGAHAPPSYGY